MYYKTGYSKDYFYVLYTKRFSFPSLFSFSTICLWSWFLVCETCSKYWQGILTPFFLLSSLNPLWLLRKSWNMKVKGKENDLVCLLVFLFESVVFLIVMFG